ncbi:MAG: aminotransferase class III-fold pyridoxal phosphate-dependent enzyme, partial [Terriglobales bacterium]
FFSIVHEICRKHGILLIADEVQSGFGRTGRMFASEHYGVEPDLICTAKSLGGGLPLAAVTGRAEVMDAACVGGLGGTFGGNPMSCEAALAAIETIEQEGLCARAEHLGELFATRAREWQRRWPLVGDVRGLGAMRAIELVRPQSRETDSREPAAEETSELVRYCYEHGLVVLSAGSYSNVIRLLAPLVITDAQFREGLDVLEAALAAVAEPRVAAAPRSA